MFDPTEGFDPAAAVTAFCADDDTKRRSDCEQFIISAYWPDQYDTTDLPLIGDVEADFRGERAVPLGGPGCPPIAEFAVADLATKTGWSIPRMRYYMADAVDARHRLPRLFNRLHTAELPYRTVQEISRQTRDLPRDLVDQIDQILVSQVTGLTGVRLDRRIAAAIITVDPERFARLADAARRARYFRRGRANEHGLTQIYAQLDRADALRLEAMVKHIRSILQEHPDNLPGINTRHAITSEEWDAIALGVLGDPIRAAQLLIEYEQPALFDQLADLFSPQLFSPPEERPRTTDGPAPSDYPTNTPNAPADPTAEAPVEEPPPDPIDNDQDRVHFAEPVRTSEPVHQQDDDTAASEASPEPVRRNRDPQECGDAIRALLKAIPASKLLPPITFHVHCAAEHLANGVDGPVRIEELGPTTLAWARDWFGPDAIINLKPVVNPAGVTPVDQYEIPERIREAVLLRNPLSRFPYSTTTSRRVDIDHTLRYRDAGPPGQTRPEDLGPLVRPEHRYKTFGPIDVRQPAPDYFTWKLDNNTILIVGPDGTTNLGNTPFAQAVWQCALRMRVG